MNERVSPTVSQRLTAHPTGRAALRVAIAVVLLLLFLFLIWHSARAGCSSLLSAYAERSGLLAAADAAANLSPGDPDAHAARGAVLEANGDLSGAIAEYTQAASLRPEDFALWLSLARVRELNGNTPLAIAAARQAVPLAPWYAQPHWQLGNLLVRAGQREDGFAQLRLAGASDPSLLPAIIDLAWQLSRGDVQYVLQAVQPRTTAAYLSLAEHFRKRDRVSDAIAMLRSAGTAAEDYKRRYVDELLTAKRFADAYAVWSIGHPHESEALGPILSDPGFEQESDLDEPGFGWRRPATEANKVAGAVLSLDTSNAKAGKSSLRIEFRGDSDPAAAVITQLVIVAPNTHYQLHFAARAEEIVSGGPPLVSVADASSKDSLGASTALTQPKSNWQDYTLDFNTNSATTAIQVGLRRESCSKSPCPIFGRLWLDGFSLRKN